MPVFNFVILDKLSFPSCPITFNILNGFHFNMFPNAEVVNAKEKFAPKNVTAKSPPTAIALLRNRLADKNIIEIKNKENKKAPDRFSPNCSMNRLSPE